jgi:predicted ATPase with chaperone activity
MLNQVVTGIDTARRAVFTACTIADLAAADAIAPEPLAEALQCRSGGLNRDTEEPCERSLDSRAGVATLFTA